MDVHDSSCIATTDACESTGENETQEVPQNENQEVPQNETQDVPQNEAQEVPQKQTRRAAGSSDGRMQVEMILDYRERALSEELRALGDVNFRVEPLPVGDVLIASAQRNLRIERKTVADLAASIKDGRYREQKCRLANRKHEHGETIIYVIEGPPAFSFEEKVSAKLSARHGLKGAALLSAVLNTIARDSMHVLTTRGVEETAQLLRGLARALEKPISPQQLNLKPMNTMNTMDATIGGDPNRHDITDDGTNADEKARQRATRLATKDARSGLWSQLAMVPGVSTGMARKIADSFGGSARAMVHALDAMEPDRRSGSKWKTWNKELQRVPGIGAVTARNVLTSMGFGDEVNNP